MSIVYDYMKQIKDKKESSAGSTLTREVSPLAKRRSSRWMMFLAALVAAGIVFALFALGPRAVRPVMRFYEAAGVDSSSIPMIRSAEAAYVLEGIIYNPAQPFAIINGKMLELKSKIGDLEVEKITPDSVMLKDTQDQTTRILRL